MLDYRKILKSRNLRMILLSALSWVPDKLLLRFQYYLQTGKKLHLRNPQSFNEKLQAYKVFYRDPLMLQCTDKIEVRKFLQSKGLQDYMVPLIGTYDKVEDINFDSLPKQFVIKTSDGGGSCQVYICRDKNEETISEIKEKAKAWMEFPKPLKHIAREWAYDNNFKRRILIEHLLTDGDKKDIDDFKFYCFQGKYKFLQWHKDRYTDHKAGHYDENWKFMPEVHVDTYPTFSNEVFVPENFGKMVEIAETLSQDFPFVRVDLYSVEDKIYIGELTFYPASGYFNYKPEYIDEWLGTFFDYPFRKK